MSVTTSLYRCLIKPTEDDVPKMKILKNISAYTEDGVSKAEKNIDDAMSWF